MEMLKPSEAALVAGVSLRDVNRVFDEHIVPEGHIAREDGRLVSAVACVFISFYFNSADRLTPKERMDTIWRADRKAPKTFKALIAHSRRSSWPMSHDFLTIDLAPFARDAEARLVKLQAAREMVEISHDVLGGMPVIGGTRIPVHDVAASVDAGHSTEQVLAAYPTLNAEKVELAVIYDKAHPIRGRPRRVVPRGAKILTDRRVPHRRAG